MTHTIERFTGEDILSVNQFDRASLNAIFGIAHEMRILVERFGGAELLQGKILANLFYEPSTRTSSSFMAAMQRLGGRLSPSTMSSTVPSAKAKASRTPSARSRATPT